MQNPSWELLAPAGKWDMLEQVIEAGADAVYLGGKKFNMRMLRSEYNFSDRELMAAVELVHSRDKKLYVTVNSLYYDWEWEALEEYLAFLQYIGVDALIVQDLGIIETHHRMKLRIPLHASVQMGISNAGATRFLEAHSFTRAILSKNLSLQEIREISQATALGIEYFVHGDLCMSHAGKCYLSSLLVGQSGNRGLCIKPCRWPFRFAGPGGQLSREPGYFLAHNDLCLYPHLSDLIEAGVSSFKIEGRMREAPYIADLVRTYRRALDAIAHGGQPGDDGYQSLYNNRVRDFCTGNIAPSAREQVIGLEGTREPLFPTRAVKIKHNRSGQDRKQVLPVPTGDMGISVKIAGTEGLNLAARHPLVQTLILSTDMIGPCAWEVRAIDEALAGLEGLAKKVVLDTPIILTQKDQGFWDLIGEMKNLNRVDAIMVHEPGGIDRAKELGKEIWGGYGLNVTNRASVRFLLQEGLSRVTVSLESGWHQVHGLFQAGWGDKLDLLVQGPLLGMVFDLCLPRYMHQSGEGCPPHCDHDRYYLVDEWEQAYELSTDAGCRSHLLHPCQRSLLSELDLLAAWGLKNMRIDGQEYDSGQLQQILEIYRDAIEAIPGGDWDMKTSVASLLALFPRGSVDLPGRYELPEI